VQLAPQVNQVRVVYKEQRVAAVFKEVLEALVLLVLLEILDFQGKLDYKD